MHNWPESLLEFFLCELLEIQAVKSKFMPSLMQQHRLNA